MWRLDAHMPFSSVTWANHVKADMDQRQGQDAIVHSLNPGTPREEVGHSTISEKEDRWDVNVLLLFEETSHGLNLARSAYDWLIALFPFAVLPRDDKEEKAWVKVHNCLHEQNESCQDQIDREAHA